MNGRTVCNVILKFAFACKCLKRNPVNSFSLSENQKSIFKDRLIPLTLLKLPPNSSFLYSVNHSCVFISYFLVKDQYALNTKVNKPFADISGHEVSKCLDFFFADVLSWL